MSYALFVSVVITLHGSTHINEKPLFVMHALAAGGLGLPGQLLHHHSSLRAYSDSYPCPWMLATPWLSLLVPVSGSWNGCRAPHPELTLPSAQ